MLPRPAVSWMPAPTQMRLAFLPPPPALLAHHNSLRCVTPAVSKQPLTPQAFCTPTSLHPRSKCGLNPPP